MGSVKTWGNKALAVLRRVFPPLAISVICLALITAVLARLYFQPKPLAAQWQALVANLISAFVGALATVIFVNLLLEHEKKRSRRPGERTALLATFAWVKDLVQLIAFMRKAAMDPGDQFPSSAYGILSAETWRVIRRLDLDKEGPAAQVTQTQLIGIPWRQHIPDVIANLSKGVGDILQMHGHFLDATVAAHLYTISQSTLFRLPPMLVRTGRLDFLLDAGIVDHIARTDMPVVLELVRHLEHLSRRHGIPTPWFDATLLSDQIMPQKGSARRP